MLKVLKLGESFGTLLASKEVAGFLFQEIHFAAQHISYHVHEDFHISIGVEGHYTQFHNRRAVQYPPWLVSFHPQGRKHADQISAAGRREIAFWLKPDTFRHVSQNLSFLDDEKQFSAGAPLQTAIRLCREFRQNDQVNGLALESLALELLVEAARQEEKQQRGMPAWLKRVKEYLHDHFRDDFSLQDLTALAGVHATHLARAFRKSFGCSVGEYVRRLRIEAARSELGQNQRSISEIALSLGFYDQAHFTKVFKSQIGFTPAAYRQLLG